MPLLARVTEDGTEHELGAHLRAVGQNMRRLVRRNDLAFDWLGDSALSQFALIVGLSHDFGKGTLYFQQYIHPEYADPDARKKQHASLSAYYTYYALTEADFDQETAILGWYIVQRHHGNLTSLFGDHGELDRKADDPSHTSLLQTQAASIQDHTQDQLEHCYADTPCRGSVTDFVAQIRSGDLITEVNQYRFVADQTPGIETYYLVLFVYSLLLDTDKMHSAGVEFDDWPSVGPDAVQSLPADAVEQYIDSALSIDTALDEQRTQASEYVTAALSATPEDQRFSLTMPTGSGKTLTALRAAFRLRERADTARPPRLIYAAPFLSIIDQNHDVFRDVLATADVPQSPPVLLRHDHLSPGYAATEGEEVTEQVSHDYYKNPDQALLLTDGWNAELVTTTFVQLFETLVTNASANARRFHKLANSVILIDEIQAVPTKYWDVIKEALILLTEQLGSSIILLTATNPLLFESGDEVTELTAPAQTDSMTMPEFADLDRVTYEFDTTPQTLSTLAKDITERVNAASDEDLMVVLNTIGTARRLYEAVAPTVDQEVVYLSTDVVPHDRQARIEQIGAASTPQLVITTQLVEAGVDIDMDRIIRDFAPIDSLVQVAGRCNRENTRDRGTVRVVRLRDTRDDAPRAYHHQYVYDPVLTDATASVLSDFSSPVTESEFNEPAIDQYFRAVQKRKATDPDDIRPAMAKLDCDDVTVSLIEEEYTTVPVFVERDDQAREAYTTMKEIYETYHGYARRGRLLGPKSAFYEHVINVSVRDDEDQLAALPPTFIDEMRHVTPEMIGRDSDRHWYHPETGFQLPENTVETRII